MVSNSGNVTLNATATGADATAAGDVIPYTQITATAATLTSATALPASGGEQRHQCATS